MREIPLLIIVENVQFCHSYIPLVFLLATMQDAQKTRTMVVLHSTVLNDDTVASFPILPKYCYRLTKVLLLGFHRGQKNKPLSFVRNERLGTLLCKNGWHGVKGDEMLAEMVAWSLQSTCRTGFVRTSNCLPQRILLK